MNHPLTHIDPDGEEEVGIIQDLDNKALLAGQTLDDGAQVWVSVRDGVIQNGGLNASPRNFSSATGLAKEPE